MTDYNIINPEIVITSNMVKYDRLGKVIPYAFYGSTDNEVILYIDLFPIYRNLISRHDRTDISDYIGLVPSIVNLCIHYRQFFKKLEVKTKIYLISSYCVPEVACKMVSGYNKLMQEKLAVPAVVEMVNFNNELLEVLCPYLPEIYFIPTQFESSVAIRYLINAEKENGNNHPHLIISRDLLPAQLTAEFLDVAYLKPNKVRGEDLSQIIPVSTHRDYFRRFSHVVYGVTLENGSDETGMVVYPSNWVVLLAFAGYKPRNIFSKVHTKVAARFINEVSPDAQIGGVNTLYDLKPDLDSKYPKTIIEPRYHTLNASGFMMHEFIRMGEYHNYQLIDLIDPGALAMINSKYFPNNPISIYQL